LGRADEKSERARKYNVPGLERGLRVVELLDDHNEGLTQEELVELTGYPRNSVYRISITLEEMGYVSRDDETRRYTLSRRMLALGWGALRKRGVIEAAMAPMRSLRDQTRETVLIGALSDQSGVVLEQVLGLHPFSFSVNVGRTLPAHAAAPCKALIAHLPRAEREKLIGNIEYTPFNERTITGPDAFRDHLGEVRERGYAVDRGEELEGVYCIAAPVLNSQGYPVASIWITGPSERLRGDALHRAALQVMACASRVTKSIGNGLSQAV
jgi:DNA-binding IclR family transcriptional regulator